EGYWKPVYTHLRLTWRLGVEDAQDATQAFFAEAFAKACLERFDPDQARFRTFLRVCADRFAQHRREAAAADKRGGDVQIVAVDFAGVERVPPGRPPAPRRLPDAA